MPFVSLPRLVLVVLYQCFVSTSLGQAHGFLPTNPCESDTSCATDPTYRFFEKEQLKAYCATPGGRKQLSLLFDKVYRKRLFESVAIQLSQRNHTLGTNWDPNDPKVQAIITKAEKQRMPTCYENPSLFYLISTYVNDIERARQQLKLPLPLKPIYGSLPTEEINAYTYPAVNDPDAVEKIGSAVGFNVQLFLFAYQMPKVTIPTIDIRNDPTSKKIQISFDKATTLSRVESEPDIKTNFVMALLEFLQLSEHSTESIDSKFDNDLIHFTTAAELFAVAHEYGHLIKRHKIIGTKQLRLNLFDADNHETTTVGVRSWQQELEADEIGIKLLIQVLQNKVTDAKNSFDRKAIQLRQLFSLYGALFFFRSQDIIDRVKFIKEKGQLPPNLSEEEKSYVRLIASGKIDSTESRRFPNIDLTSHPPAWLRYERVAKIIETYVQMNKFPEEALEYAEIGKGINENVETLWGITAPLMPVLFAALEKNSSQSKISYSIVPDFWDITFRYNPELRNAINVFLMDDSSDSMAISSYKTALEKDWLLLSGIQTNWALAMLKNDVSNARKEALSILALAGDLHLKQWLQDIPTSNWAPDDQKIYQKALRFLDTYGRVTTIDAFAHQTPESFDLSTLFAYPKGLEKYIKSFLPDTISADIRTFLRKNRALAVEDPLSRMALSMYVNHTPIDVTYDFWTSLLLRSGRTDLALSYAEHLNSKMGGSALLENNIGNIFTVKGDLRGAITHYRKSIEFGRLDGWPEVNMANNFANLNELDSAEQWFEKGIAKTKTARSADEYAQYLNDFAWFLVTKYKEDTVRTQKALKLSLLSNELVGYNDPNYMDTLAECLATIGRTSEAIEIYDLILSKMSLSETEEKKYKIRRAEMKAKLGKSHNNSKAK